MVFIGTFENTSISQKGLRLMS